MKHYFFLLFCMLSAGVLAQLPDSIYSPLVKTVTLYRDGIVLSTPILTLNNESQLLLTFDMLEAEPENLRYRFTHCDANWQADEMQPYEYFSGFEDYPIENFQNSFTTLQPYIHYHQAFPSNYDRFLISGNYLLTVFLDGEPDSILFTRRFFVSEEAVSASMSTTRATSQGDFNRDQEVSMELGIPKQQPSTIQGLLRPEYLIVKVQQNGRRDNIHTLNFSNYSNGSLCYKWKPENCFPGGNTFRYFDLSNLRTPMYNVMHVETFGGETFAMLRPEEDRSGKAYVSSQSLNGGMKTNIWDRNDPQVEADYVWVNFALPMKKPFLNGTVHVVGDLTDWQLDDHSAMQWDAQHNAYTLRLLLKQGYYSYQFHFLPVGEKTALTATIEGDHYETPNTYTAFIYMRTPGARYDRLIKVKQQ